MIDLSALGPNDWIVMSGSALLIGISKTGLPGVAILAILMAAQVIPPRESTGVILPMLIVGDIFAVAYYRRHAVWKYLVRMLPIAAVGVFLGYLGMKVVTDKQLGPIIGGIVLALLVLNYLNNRASGSGEPDQSEDHIPHGWWFSAVMGLAAGITTMMANAAGPIMIIYLLAMRLPRDAFIGTGAWFFLMLNCFKVPFSVGLSLITPDTLKFNLMLAPVIIAGAIAGVYLAKRIPQKAFNAIVQLLAAAAAIKLLF